MKGSLHSEPFFFIYILSNAVWRNWISQLNLKKKNNILWLYLT